ncbi:IclR family transcriptional regulator [Leucothrix mucor]|uniref:IclR family transcriptional regulator n=1 Tax=Leucothrix mucor TaxID=45248 RepID=UPI0003B7A90E|nr:IclR family transcriptional regulator [Leucothrix mucor]
MDRAFNLLSQLAESGADPGMSLAELSAASGLANSTTHRLLVSMKHLGYVEYEESKGLWSVGIKAFSVGNAYLRKRDFITQARPIMRELVAETGETSNLAVIKGDRHVFVGQIECKEVMRMVVQVGSGGYLHASGVGKALLSAMQEADVRQIIERTGLKPLSEKTIVTIDGLLAELAKIRKTRYALDDEEQTPGLRCIASNIYDEYGEAIAAVSISGPSVRILDTRIEAIANSVIQKADAITHTIGGRRPRSTDG